MLSVLSLPFTSLNQIATNYAVAQENNSQSRVPLSIFPPADSSVSVLNHTQQILQNKNNTLLLISDIVEKDIKSASTLLQLTSVLPEVQSLEFVNQINKTYNGISSNSDLAKRGIAQTILNSDKNFGSVAFVMPNGDIYLLEPYLNQKNLPKLNYADFEWYKGVISTNSTLRELYFYISRLSSNLQQQSLCPYMTQ